MIVCDICGKKINVFPKAEIKKTSIHTHYTCKAWQSVEIDMCDQCKKQLQDEIKTTEARFYEKRVIPNDQ